MSRFLFFEAGAEVWVSVTPDMNLAGILTSRVEVLTSAGAGRGEPLVPAASSSVPVSDDNDDAGERARF